MAAAGSGQKAKSGTWEDTSADAAGTAAHFRIYDSGGSTCHIQGTVTAIEQHADGTRRLHCQMACADEAGRTLVSAKASLVLGA